MPAPLTIWTTPDSYAGFNPEGHIVVVTRTRDSDALDRSNWQAARERLAKAAGLDTIPADDSAQPVYDWRASHWACGWIEYLMVRPDAPEAVLAEAQAIADELADYPILDEDAFSELEWQECADYWASLPVRERADMIRRYCPGVSVFTARRDEIPSDDTGTLYEALRGI